MLLKVVEYYYSCCAETLEFTKLSKSTQRLYVNVAKHTHSCLMVFINVDLFYMQMLIDHLLVQLAPPGM